MSNDKKKSNINNILSKTITVKANIGCSTINNSIIIKKFLKKEKYKIYSESDVSYHFEKEIEKFSVRVFIYFGFSPMWVSIKTYFDDELYIEDCNKLMISTVEDLKFLLSRINLNNFFISNVTFNNL